MNSCSFFHDLNCRALQILLLLLVSSFVTGTAGGQDTSEEGNWSKEIGRGDDYYSRFDFRRYTKEDVKEARDRYLTIASTPSSDPWAGSYYRQTMLGGSQIIWNPQIGFVYTYIYHTLASLDYGSVISKGDSVSFTSERPKKISYFLQGEHSRVKLGERHLLVSKSRMAEFAVWAVGREVPTGQRAKEIYTEDGFFWEKIDDERKPIATIPTFPSSYAHLIRQPILAKVLAVGTLRIKRETSAQWETTTIDHLRMLTLSAGRNKGVEVGMRFWIDDLEEWVEVKSVTATRSRVKLERSFIDGREYCSNYENYKLTEFPCRDPKVGNPARTRVDYF